MAQEKFSLVKANEMYNKDDIVECRKYITKFFYPLINGNHYVLTKDKKITFLNYTEVMIRQVYLNRLPKDIEKWYLKKTDVYELVCEVNLPKIDTEKKVINIFGGFMYEKKNYNEFSKKIKDNVNIMLNFIKEVICSSNEKVFEYVIKWLSNMARGNKNNSCLYLKTEAEGVGKSFFTDYLFAWVFGKAISAKSNTDPLLTSYNKILAGKLLVIFEELPVFSDNQWEGVSAKLKIAITDERMTYSDKFEHSFEAKNFNNYIINTNRDAIKKSNGRRYVCLVVIRVLGYERVSKT